MTLPENGQLRLYPDSLIAEYIYVSGFESAERDFVRSFLRPNDTFVDVGANIGLFTVIAARRVGPAGRVLAFEPTTKTYQRLLENVSLNGLLNVSAYRMALSDTDGRQRMHVAADGYDGWNSLCEPIAGSNFVEEEVQSIRWDHFVETEGKDKIGPIALMKIDVEGWEGRVITGAADLFSDPEAPALLVEFADQTSASAGATCQELYANLERLGYRMFDYDASSRELVPHPLRPSYVYSNLVAIKRPEEARARLRKGVN